MKEQKWEKLFDFYLKKETHFQDSKHYKEEPNTEIEIVESDFQSAYIKIIWCSKYLT